MMAIYGQRSPILDDKNWTFFMGRSMKKNSIVLWLFMVLIIFSASLGGYLNKRDEYKVSGIENILGMYKSVLEMRLMVSYVVEEKISPDLAYKNFVAQFNKYEVFYEKMSGYKNATIEHQLTINKKIVEEIYTISNTEFFSQLIQDKTYRQEFLVDLNVLCDEHRKSSEDLRRLMLY
jgi:hypothetical protein